MSASAAVNEKKSPGVMAPAITWWPPYPERAMMAEGAAPHERVGDLVGAVVLERQAEQPLVHAVEALGLVGLASERLDDLHPEKASCSRTFSSATFSCERLLMR